MVAYHFLHGQTGFSKVCANDKQNPSKPHIYHKRLERVQPDNISKMKTKNCMSTRKFRLEILDNLSKRSVYFENSRLAEPDLSHPLQSDQNFRNWVNNRQPN